MKLDRLKQFTVTFWIFLKRLWEKFQEDKCFVRASGLSFNTLLALVPFSALFFYLLSAFGVVNSIVQSIQKVIVHQLIPTSQQLIMDYITRFITNARALGVVGLFMFLITTVFLLNTIQSNFNDIWGSRPRRFSLKRIAAYISVLIVGSFLFSIGLNLTEIVKSFIFHSKIKEISYSLNFFLNIFPVILLFLSFVLILQLLPSGRVDFASSIIGAVVGTFLWEIAKRLFFLWTQYFFRMSVVYGSLAAIPILLLWLYVAWLVVLLSLEVTYIYQYRRSIWFKRTAMDMSSSEKLLIGLEIYLYIANRFYKGEEPPTIFDIERRMHIPHGDIVFFKEIFAEHGLLIEAGEGAAGLVPSRSLDKIPVSKVLESILGEVNIADETVREAKPLYSEIVQSMYRNVKNISVMDYLLKLEGGFGEDIISGVNRRNRWYDGIAKYLNKIKK